MSFLSDVLKVNDVNDIEESGYCFVLKSIWSSIVIADCSQFTSCVQ